MEELEIDGRRSRVYRHGEGTPLLYLHSELGEVGNLPLFTTFVAAGFAVCAPELPGFGKSDPVLDWHRIEDVTFTLRRIMDACDLDRPAVVGSSLGAWLSAELAVWFPDRIGPMALACPFGLHLAGEPIFELFGTPPEELSRRIFTSGTDLLSVLSPVVAGDDDPNALLLHVFHAMEASARIGWSPYMHDPKLPERLPHVGSPALVVWGDGDGILPRAHAEAYAVAIPDARLEVLPRCGHLPALECPDRLAGSAIEFFAER